MSSRATLSNWATSAWRHTSSRNQRVMTTVAHRPHLCCCCPAQGNVCVCPCLHVTVRYEMGSSFTWLADTRRVRLSVPVARNPANELINARRLMCAHIKFGTTTMMMMAIMRAATASSCSLGSRPTSLTAVNSLVYLKVALHFSFFLPPL